MNRKIRLLLVIAYLITTENIFSAEQAEELPPKTTAVKNIKKILSLYFNSINTIPKNKQRLSQEQLNHLIFAATQKDDQKARENLFEIIKKTKKKSLISPMLIVAGLGGISGAYLSESPRAVKSKPYINAILTIGAIGFVAWKYLNHRWNTQLQQEYNEYIYALFKNDSTTPAQQFNTLTDSAKFNKFATTMDDFFDANEVIKRIFQQLQLSGNNQAHKLRQALQWALENLNKRSEQAANLITCILQQYEERNPLNSINMCKLPSLSFAWTFSNFTLKNYLEHYYQYQLFEWLFQLKKEDQLSVIKSLKEKQPKSIVTKEGLEISDFQEKRDLDELPNLFQENDQMLGNWTLDEVLKAFISPDITDYYGNPIIQKVKVLRQDDELIGFVVYHISKNKGVIEHGAIKKTLQGQGHGTLISYVIDDLFKYEQVQAVVLDTLTTNKPMQALAFRFKFENQGERVVESARGGSIHLFRFELTREKYESLKKESQHPRSARVS